MKVVQAYCTPGKYDCFDWDYQRIRLKSLLVTAYQYKFTFPEDSLLFYTSANVLTALSKIVSIEKFPWDRIDIVPEAEVTKTFNEAEYTAIRWKSLNLLENESGIFLDPDILIFPDTYGEIKKARQDLKAGQVFLGGYEQGLFTPDIKKKHEKQLFGNKLKGKFNMNSGFMVISGNFATKLMNYELKLQKKSKESIPEQQRMRVLEVIDGSGPKCFIEDFNIPYRSINFGRYLVHMTGGSVPGTVVNTLHLDPSNFTEKIVNRRKQVLDDYFTYILEQDQPCGHTLEECETIMIDLAKSRKNTTQKKNNLI